MVEQRRTHRSPLEAKVEVHGKGEAEMVVSGQARDVSLGGMFVVSEAPFPFGAEVRVHIFVPGAKAPMVLPAVVRWTREDGMGVQFGLLGARETHLITEIVRTAPR